MPANADTHNKVVDIGVEQENLRELINRRQNLLLELRNYEQNKSISAKQSVDPGKGMGVIPAQTQLLTSLSINSESEEKDPHVEITLTTSNDTVIRGVLIFAEGIFDGECHVVHPRDQAVSQAIVIPVFPPRDVPVDLHIKAYVGYKGNKNFHVFELTRQLPRFAMYCRVDANGHPISPTKRRSPEPPVEPVPEPKGHVTFQVSERPARVAMWINQNFLLGEELEPSVVSSPGATGGGQASLHLIFNCLRVKNQYFFFEMNPDGKITIRCDNMDFCGDVVQALAEYLGLDDLKSTCDFPEDCNKLDKLLETADELQTVRQRLSAEMADNSGIIRTLIVRAEDSRLMMDM